MTMKTHPERTAFKYSFIIYNWAGVGGGMHLKPRLGCIHL